MTGFTSKSIDYNNGEIKSVKLIANTTSTTLEYFVNADGNTSQFNTGTIYGATYTTGIVGNYALSFDGINDYINLGNINFGITNAFTISLWLKANVWNQEMDVYGSSGKDFRFGHYDANNWQLYLYGPNDYVSYNVNSLNTSLWYHFVGTWNGAVAKIYINGIEVASKNISGTLTGGSGTRFIGCYDSTNKLFNGSIDEVLIYNRSLNETEISNLYNKQVVTDGLVAKYSFEEGIGNYCYDTSNWERVSNGVIYTLARPGQDLKYRIIDKGTGSKINKLTIQSYK